MIADKGTQLGLSHNVMSFFYVMWNLFTVSSLQFCSDSTIASLEANQNRPKIQYYGNK